MHRYLSSIESIIYFNVCYIRHYMLFYMELIYARIIIDVFVRGMDRWIRTPSYWAGHRRCCLRQTCLVW